MAKHEGPGVPGQQGASIDPRLRMAAPDGPSSRIAEWFALAQRHHQAGRVGEAKALYRQILAADPNHAETLHLFGILARQAGRNDVAVQLIGKAISISPRSPDLHLDLSAALQALGRLQDAEAACRRAIDLKPGLAQAHANLGFLLQAQGQQEEAVAAYRRVVSLNPDWAEIHSNLAGALRALGRLDESAAACRRAVDLRPRSAEAHNNLGIVLQQSGRQDEAAAAFQRAIDLRPDYAEAFGSLGVALQALGRLEDAVAAFRRSIELAPGQAETHNNLGFALQALDRPEEAAASYRRAITLKPDLAEAHNNLSGILRSLGRNEEAVAACRRAIELKPDLAEAHNSLGMGLQALGRLDEAAAACRRAIELKPDHAEAHFMLGVILQDQGQLEGAAASLRRAIELEPGHALAHGNLVRLGPTNDSAPEAEAAFEALRRQFGRLGEFEAKERSLLLFAMGKALEDRGEFDEAFDCMAQANGIRRAGLSFDIGVTERLMASIAKAFDHPLLDRLEGAGPADGRPIFIVGMPRSGTTLVEQIISAHPAVRGAGEIDNLPRAIATIERRGSAYPALAEAMTGADCAAIGQAYLDSLPSLSPGETRITDKLLSNFLYLGLIRLCLPNATIVHCRRDPRDVCLSCFAIPFNDSQEFAYDLAELGRYWRAYDGLMAHWRAALPPGRMLEVQYEALVDDVETWARRLIAHCGLDWDDACLRFYESRRAVRTASSAQVRRPIYADSIGRWRRFAGRLGPLLDALGEPWTKN